MSKSYEEEANLRYTDENAIEEAMKGHSTKEDYERGYGIRTSRRVVCEGLGGDFMVLSGKSALISSRRREVITNFDDFYWQGVVVAYRIPRPRGPIDITPFIE